MSGDWTGDGIQNIGIFSEGFWALDAARAQARFYPAIHPLQSYSQDIEVLAPFWSENGNPQWPEQRRRFLGLLEEQSKLERMARIDPITGDLVRGNPGVVPSDVEMTQSRAPFRPRIASAASCPGSRSGGPAR